MADTPVSVYYDAPLAPLNMNSYLGQTVEHDANDPIPHPNGSEGWLPATDLPPMENGTANHRDTILKNRSSPTPDDPFSSPQPPTQPQSSPYKPRRSGSLVRSSSKRSNFTTQDGKALPANSTFSNGAATTGGVVMDEELQARVDHADTALTPKQKSKIHKSEIKEGKRILKIVQQEGKVERQALAQSIKELEEAQKLQKAAVKNEARAHAAQSKMHAIFKKHEAAYLATKTKYETALAQYNAETDALETIRNGAREATDRVQEKSLEVDGLRTMFGVDERERELKLQELKGKKRGSGMWKS